MQKEKKYKIVITGGGTGGHIFPLLAIVRELKKILPENILDIHYVGPKDNISQRYMKEEGIALKYIHTGKLRRYHNAKSIFQNILDILFRVPLGIIQSFFYFYFLSPDLVFSKGGHGSFPVVVVGKIFQVPIFIHESDCIIGAVNRILQRFSAEVFVSFPQTEGVDSKKMFVVGNPVRNEILEGKNEEAIKMFNLTKEKPVILILGGSQGSERINDLFLSISTKILEKFEIIHQCGEEKYKQVFAEAGVVLLDQKLKRNYHPFSFFDEEQLKNAYACSDLIVSRAGSGSIFEIASNGKASVLIPLPESAQNHQVKNAYQYSSAKAAVVFEEENLSAHFFLGKINELFSPIEQIREMEENAKRFAKPRAGYIIASYIKEYLTRNE
jgi:UDP-N-acetylglucosamine--N-acetylmuramyl-(pentapeptide) pyrophosphoryl-undecaprenol N-acetylglucosamine transferase